jgi:general secretion pathway protein G
MIWRSEHMQKQDNREKEAGYTLLEVMVVLLILVLIASVAAPVMFNQLGKAKTRTARLQIEALSAQLDFFRIDVQRYPTSQEGLRTLVEEPEGIEAWAGPYIKKSASLTDPWGRGYLYRSPGEHGEFDLFTLGSDNAEGGDGEDSDVTNWE